MSDDRYEILKAGTTLCPWSLRRDGEDIAHFTTEDRAIDYRDYLIAKEDA